jgi:tetratricopeptide (TPR) repeat protein
LIAESRGLGIVDQNGAGDLTGRLAEIGRGYQQVLEQSPHHPVALVGMSLVALASRQAELAVKMAGAAVSVAPKMGPAWVALGQAQKAAGRCGEAERAYREAIALDGMDPLARMAMGELKIATDRPEEAIVDYELALRKNPVLVSAHLGLGHALACLRRFDEALDRYEQTLALRPRLAEAEFAAGFALVRLGRPKEAEARYRKALALRPDFAACWLNMGSLLREQGQEIYAEAALLRALELRPDLVGAWLNLAVLERSRKQMDKALDYLRKAFAIDPNRVDTHVTWAQYCCGERDMAGAWGWLRWALVRDPDNAEAVNMHGILLHTEGRFAEAVEVFGRAEELGNLAASSNRGNSLLDLGRVDEALQAHEKAVARDPECAGARYNLAMTRLRVGDFERGWQGYEARWEFREVHRLPRKFRQPRWRGEPLEGRRVLLHAEQGLGDSIQFCRYVSMVTARGGSVLLQLQTGVKRLLGSLEAVRSGQAEIVQLGVEPPPFELECPLLSLPAVFGTTLETVPWDGAYLTADSDVAAEKARQFGGFRSGRKTLRVGIGWAGNPGYKADRHRSTRLNNLFPLLRTPGVTWISLQKGEPAEQLAELPGDIRVFDGCSQDRDLADTAALIESLDLVITTDTCIAHLAGAMAKPVWILLPHLADWRWMRKIETTPWYPTARLLRQRAQGDWEELVQRAIGDLRLYRAQHAPPVRSLPRPQFAFPMPIPA